MSSWAAWASLLIPVYFQKQGQDSSSSSLDDEQLGGLGLSFNSCIFLRSRARTAAAAAWMMSSWAAWAYLLIPVYFSEAGPGRQQQQQQLG
jgi:hypothetical protein